ncbi:MAG: PTS system mannose/fructose/sorbose family transporter subunit IID [Deltaproteobacteria bacterium]|jgi:mannose/fructose/N-acetylgalactosamine-specific phosphotransferase system component IID|nr:PTS system mannose/fructose/sorbose family transporter subunit IID [Deltaproteobacteria bacterium]
MSGKDKATEARMPDGPGGPQGPPRTLDRYQLLKIALKLCILEALWNPRSQQSVGLLTVIDPALAITHAGHPQALKEARKRNLDFFNTNPITSGLVIGALLRLEEEQAAGELTPQTDKKLVQALSSTLAAEGDQLFWQAWLPLCCLTGVLVTTLTGSLLGPLLIPIMFCALAWPVRIWGVFKGYELGCDVYRVYQLSHGERLIWAIQWLWLLILAFLTALAAYKVFLPAENPSRWSLLWALLSILAVWLYRRVSFGHWTIVGYLLYPVLLVVLFALATLFV